MQLIHALRPVGVGLFLIAIVVATVGARYESFQTPFASGSDDPCDAFCSVGLGGMCGELDHTAESISAKADSPNPHGTHETCETGKCAWEGGDREMHPTCGGSGLRLARSGDYERLKAAILAQDDRSVERLMRRYPSTLVLNEDRESIQVIDCERVPVANLPLQTPQFARLVNAQ